MLSRSTVVVIGAGASYELGLPLGADLKRHISDLLNITFPDGYRQTTGDNQITEIMRELARERDETSYDYLLYKCWLIRDAMPASISIDNLLDAHRSDPDVAFLGKLAIAKSILKAERSSKLFKSGESNRKSPIRELEDTWLIPMFQLMTEGVTKENARKIFENVTFIVFNYDRCLEYFIPIALKAYYGFDDREAEEIAALANIIHPYGRVGEFGSGRSLAAVGFGAERFNLRQIAEGIRTFSEGIEHESHQIQIKEAIAQAEQIIFLGFAFHPLNMETLAVSESSEVSKIFGTTIGLSDAAVSSIENDICGMIGKRLPGSMVGAAKANELSEMNLDSRSAHDFLAAHFRGIG